MYKYKLKKKAVSLQLLKKLLNFEYVTPDFFSKLYFFSPRVTLRASLSDAFNLSMLGFLRKIVYCCFIMKMTSQKANIWDTHLNFALVSK